MIKELRSFEITCDMCEETKIMLMAESAFDLPPVLREAEWESRPSDRCPRIVCGALPSICPKCKHKD